MIGRTFGLPLLERLLPRARLLPTLSELQWLQLVVEEQRRTAPEYRFRHGLVQEAAYDDPARGATGASCTGAWARRSWTSIATRRRRCMACSRHHFAEADEPEQAIEYLLKAGDAARAAYADEEAIELYQRALGLHGADRRRRRAPGRRCCKIALAHHLAFDYRAANEAFGEALRATRAPHRGGWSRASGSAGR